MWEHNFCVCFLPTDTARQRVKSLDVAVSDCPGFSLDTGAFGSRRCYGRIPQPHTAFQVRIDGVVETGLDIFEERTCDPLAGALFLPQTALTQPGPALREYHRRLDLQSRSGDYEKALRLLHALKEDFAYRPGATAVHEPAEAAFAKGQGVCQDYAHIMLSLLRLEGIPARYAVGMTTGEGSSHAWVEALCKGYWYGFDPTNDALVDGNYIRVAVGRDSGDCGVIRGTFYGQVEQSQSEHVWVRAC